MQTEDRIQLLISELLARSQHGQSLTRREAAYILGMHTREVQNVIAILQSNGLEVISDSAGYWIPRGMEDLRRVVKAARTRHSHAIGELADASRFMKIARKIKQARQQSLFYITDVKKINIRG